jgi:hypothetical protein
LTTTPLCDALAFDGGIGGLGKTKPSTGVVLFDESSAPIQNDQGIISAEIESITRKPILVSFQAPWPLLASSGLEARDIRNPESSFIQVVPRVSNWQDKKVFQQLLIETVFAKAGKFSAYGEPYGFQTKPFSLNSDDIVSKQQRQQLFSVSFTTLTPAMRESERKVWIQPKEVDDTLVLLIVGTTTTRFPPNEGVFKKVLSSFTAVAAPDSNFKTRLSR